MIQISKKCFPFLMVILFFTTCVPYEDTYNPEQSYQSPSNDIETDSNDFPETGIASFVADEQQGKRTYYGEIYNIRELVAAHPKLPYNSIVEVTNLANNKKVEVRIIDKGPYVRGRIIDLSFEAAKQLDFIEEGTTEVKIKLIRVGE